MDILDRWPDRISPEPNSGCWLWDGAYGSTGYGQTPTVRENHTRKAHRYSWICSNGPIPAGLDVLHKCDNPACVNPAHLEIGTHTKNMRDARARRVFKPIKSHGEQHYKAIATLEQIKKIRSYSGKQPHGFWARLARSMNLSPHVIYDVHRGRSWRRD